MTINKTFDELVEELPDDYRNKFLYEMPLEEFQFGGFVDSLLRARDYDESGRVTIANWGAWGWTIEELIEHLKPTNLS